jgi:3-oxoacyl-[acyl-carrier-protein] synthase-3
MSSRIRSIITGTGKYIPNKLVKNSEFIDHSFYEKDGSVAK